MLYMIWNHACRVQFFTIGNEMKCKERQDAHKIDKNVVTNENNVKKEKSNELDLAIIGRSCREELS